MLSRTRIFLIGVLLVGVGTFWVLVGTGASAPAGQVDPDLVSSIGERPSATQEELPCTAGDSAPNFDLYSLGTVYDGLPLTTVIRRCDNSASGNGSANYVSYIYGDCDATPPLTEAGEGSDGGCAPPIEVQVWPACERTVVDYDLSPEPTTSQIKGVPSAVFADRVELYTGNSTVVVFGLTGESAAKVAEAIRPADAENAPVQAATASSAAAELPQPVTGAIDGKLSCQGKEASS